ncbi:uncharacterized hydrophobic domain protein [Methanocaldococcus vulcanius M7]|uniref:Uncharacterized hydrophobic domain protein n=1 Tax=Methanocaldococcus vulcanius (strain ATCC 700851 / DSM 12094 / M7) TaxID=579137 RepID=C9REX5_METVM|nr:TIGR00341 family protein [Methanocaldococcus vulcanius]ACX72127.1 uncharacterized hydrophobic domain protein [Methanocaldococcus vulcanius M7]
MRYMKIIIPKKFLKEVEEILKCNNAYSISIIQPLKTSIDDGIIITCNAEAKDAESIVLELKKLGLGEKGHGSVTIMPANITFSCRDEGMASTTLSPLELYYKAKTMVKITKNVIIKVILASIMGVIGLIEHNIPTLIGAMIIAPLVDTVMGSAIGTVLGDKKLFIEGMKKELICSGVVIICALIPSLFFVSKGLVMQYLSETSILLSAIVAIIAGISGGMSIASGKDYEIIGVTIDVSILIPALLMGMALATGDLYLIYITFILLALNIILLDIGGYIGLRYKLGKSKSLIK